MVPHLLVYVRFSGSGTYNLVPVFRAAVPVVPVGYLPFFSNRYDAGSDFEGPFPGSLRIRV